MRAAHMLSVNMKGNSKDSGAQQSCHFYQCGWQSTVFEGAVPLCCCEETAACHWKTLDWAYALNLINQITCTTSTVSGSPSATTNTVEQLFMGEGAALDKDEMVQEETQTSAPFMLWVGGRES